MTRFAGWVNPETMRLMGMSLLHFLWQGLAIAAAAFVATSMVRRASAKYVVAVAMLAVMVAAPALTFIILTRQQESTRAIADVANAADLPPAEIMAAAAPAKQIFDLKFAGTRNPSSIYLLWFVEAWFVGVVLLSLRPAAGFFLIERLRFKKGAPVVGALGDRCLALQQQLGLNRVVRYCESLQLQAPAVVGWFRPMILLPVSALTGLTAQQLEAVIAHELAHVKRLDAFVNLFQIAAETLLFYHPAVWWVSKRIRAERENCCDDVAISICGNRGGVCAGAGDDGGMAECSCTRDGGEPQSAGGTRGAIAGNNETKWRTSQRGNCWKRAVPVCLGACRERVVGRGAD